MTPIDPLDFLTFAQSLNSNGSEAEARTIIGRAYYAIFLKQRDYFARTGRFVGTGAASDHGGVIATLRRSRRMHAGNQLSQLRDLREHSDYEIGSTIGRAEVQRALNLARELSEALSSDWSSTSS